MGAPRMFCSDCQPKAERLNPVGIHAEMPIPPLASLVRRCLSLLWRRRSARRRVNESDLRYHLTHRHRGTRMRNGPRVKAPLEKGDPAGTGDLAQAVCVHLGIREGHSSSKTRGTRLQFDTTLRRLQRPITSSTISNASRVSRRPPFFGRRRCTKGAELLQVAFASN